MKRLAQISLYLSLAAGFAVSDARAEDQWYSASTGGSVLSSPLPAAVPEPASRNLKCSACYGSLKAAYSPARGERLSSLTARLSDSPGYTTQEARNYFEAARSFPSSANLDRSAEAKQREKARLLGIVKSGTYYYGNAVLNVGTGAWDCFTHATRLKEFLGERTSPAEYRFEVVNGWSDPRKFSAGNILFANHYVVRAVSLKTGHSYICDGYSGASVKDEADDKHIVFDEFEECVYNKYLTATVGDGFARIVAQWTPMQKGLLAADSKAGAAACLSGAEYWVFK